MSPAAGDHALECITTFAEELQNLFRLRDLERKPANPIYEVVPWRHTATFFIATPSGEGLSNHEISYSRRPPKSDQARKKHYEVLSGRQPSISTLNKLPPMTPSPLIVINSNQKLPARLNESGHIIQGLPHLACMMQHAPRVHEVVLPK